MSLANAVKAGPPRIKRGEPCRMGRIIARLEGDELAALFLMLEDDEWTGANIADELKENGHQVEVSSVNRHRRGGCKCEPIA